MPQIKGAGESERGWHRLQSFAECPQRYAWRYESPFGKDGERGEQVSPALVKGALAHMMLAQHYLRINEPNDWTHPVDALREVAEAMGGEDYIPILVKVYESYVSRYEQEDKLWRVLQVEHSRQKLYGGRYLLTGRIDLEVEDASGRVFVVDHKTTGRITTAHKDYFSVSGQLIGYADMAREEYGSRLSGVVVNLVQVSEEPKFERFVLSRSPGMESCFERNVIDLEQAIERLKESGRPYDQWPRAMSELTCVHRYGPCPYVLLCRYGSQTVAGSWKWETSARDST